MTHLLDEQLRRIWDCELHDPLARLAFRTPSIVPQHPAGFAYLRLERVGGYHQTLQQELRRAVAYQTGPDDQSGSLNV